MVESILSNPNNYLRKTTALSKALEDRFRRLTAVTPGGSSESLFLFSKAPH